MIDYWNNRDKYYVMYHMVFHMVFNYIIHGICMPSHIRNMKAFQDKYYSYYTIYCTIWESKEKEKEI